jgi:hypothetical protein
VGDFYRAQQLVEFQSLVPPDSRSFCMVEVVEDASMIVINRIRDGKDHTPTQTDKCVTYIASHHYSFNFKGIIN